jgi:predicted TIM-barrel fold metal-dependent hydrolase
VTTRPGSKTSARAANDEATDAVRTHPDRFRAFATLPTSDPQAAAAELERCARPDLPLCQPPPAAVLY